MIPAFYPNVQEKFTTNNSPAVYQDLENKKAVQKYLRHRNSEFHVNREVI